MVLIVQFISLKNEIGKMFKSINYVKIVFAIGGSSIFSFCIKFFVLDVFVKLLIASVLYFSIYIISLIIISEKLVIDIWDELISKIKTFSRLK